MTYLEGGGRISLHLLQLLGRFHVRARTMRSVAVFSLDGCLFGADKSLSDAVIDGAS